MCFISILQWLSAKCPSEPSAFPSLLVLLQLCSSALWLAVTCLSPSGFTGSVSLLAADLLAFVNKLHIWGKKKKWNSDPKTQPWNSFRERVNMSERWLIFIKLKITLEKSFWHFFFLRIRFFSPLWLLQYVRPVKRLIEQSVKQNFPVT